jgi:hypothetical protein
MSVYFEWRRGRLLNGAGEFMYLVADLQALQLAVYMGHRRKERNKQSCGRMQEQTRREDGNLLNSGQK